MKVRIVITGRMYHTAQHAPREIDLAEGASLQDALAQLTASLPEPQTLPPSCLVSVGDQHLGTIAEHQPYQLRDGEEVVLIAPVAGG